MGLRTKVYVDPTIAGRLGVDTSGARSRCSSSCSALVHPEGKACETDKSVSLFSALTVIIACLLSTECRSCPPQEALVYKGRATGTWAFRESQATAVNVTMCCQPQAVG